MAIQSSYFDPADGSVGTVDLAFVPVRSLRIPLTAATTTTPGAVCSVANPEGVNLIVYSAQAYIGVPATAPNTINLGIATNGSTTANNILDQLDAQAPLPVASVSLPADAVLWTTSKFLTGTASDTLAGMSGAYLYVQYIPA